MQNQKRSLIKIQTQGNGIKLRYDENKFNKLKFIKDVKQTFTIERSSKNSFNMMAQDSTQDKENVNQNQRFNQKSSNKQQNDTLQFDTQLISPRGFIHGLIEKKRRNMPTFQMQFDTQEDPNMQFDTQTDVLKIVQHNQINSKPKLNQNDYEYQEDISQIQFYKDESNKIKISRKYSSQQQCPSNIHSKFDTQENVLSHNQPDILKIIQHNQINSKPKLNLNDYEYQEDISQIQFYKDESNKIKISRKFSSQQQCPSQIHLKTKPDEQLVQIMMPKKIFIQFQQNLNKTNQTKKSIKSNQPRSYVQNQKRIQHIRRSVSPVVDKNRSEQMINSDRHHLQQDQSKLIKKMNFCKVRVKTENHKDQIIDIQNISQSIRSNEILLKGNTTIIKFQDQEIFSFGINKPKLQNFINHDQIEKFESDQHHKFKHQMIFGQDDINYNNSMMIDQICCEKLQKQKDPSFVFIEDISPISQKNNCKISNGFKTDRQFCYCLQCRNDEKKLLISQIKQDNIKQKNKITQNVFLETTKNDFITNQKQINDDQKKKPKSSDIDKYRIKLSQMLQQEKQFQ